MVAAHPAGRAWPKSSATQAALEVVEDRLSYAEILLDLVQHVRRAPAGLEMARACTVRARVEHILAATTAPAKLGWRKRIGTAARILPVVVVSAGSIAYATRAGVDAGARQRGRCRRRRCASRSPSPSIHWAAASIFTVSRDGDESVRPAERAAKAPPGRGGRWNVFLPGAGRPDHSWPSAMNDSRPNRC